LPVFRQIKIFGVRFHPPAPPPPAPLHETNAINQHRGIRAKLAAWTFEKRSKHYLNRRIFF